MAKERKIEIFSAGCPLCESAVTLVNELACPSCDVEVIDTHDTANAGRARQSGVVSVPAILVDGHEVDCFRNGAIDETHLREAGVGRPIA